MTNKNTVHITEKTSRQWAWQFLRRNASYRAAYSFIHALSDIQKNVFLKLTQGQLGLYSENWPELGKLPVRLFDEDFLWGLKPETENLDDFIQDKNRPLSKATKSAPKIAIEIDDLILRVSPEYRHSSYGLCHWVDPDIDDLTPEEADSIWFYAVPMEPALSRAPWLDDKGLSFERSEWKGVGAKELMGIKNEVEHEVIHTKQNPNQPVQAETLPLKKGINGAIFEINNFSSPPSFFTSNHTRIPVGRDPEPMSLTGDTLVRVTFDVGLPIQYQLDAIKMQLIAHQKELQNAGFIEALPVRKGRQGVFASYIEILDLHESGMSYLDIAIRINNLECDVYIDAQGKEFRSYIDPKRPELATSQEHTSAIRKQLERARHLRNHGYRSLALQID
ncbi:MAG TPA: hypothetical protein PK347_02750 [Burkholderiaceae bacterium]|nr:hypothetical protein [Burkholderiaceae bacterium]